MAPGVLLECAHVPKCQLLGGHVPGPALLHSVFSSLSKIHVTQHATFQFKTRSSVASSIFTQLRMHHSPFRALAITLNRSLVTSQSPRPSQAWQPCVPCGFAFSGHFT